MSNTVKTFYEWTVKIDSYMVGPDRCLRPSYQLKLQQEVGERHFVDAGLGYEALLREGLVFVLTRLKTVILRAPRLNETVTIRTWHRQTKGAQFYRCYRFLSADGEVLIDSVTAFSLVDPVEHKLLRPSAFDKFGIEGSDQTVEHCSDPSRLRPPEGMTSVGEHIVRWSEIDFNGHLNNTEYADLVCDYPPEGLAGRRITGLEIGYHREVREGQVLSLTACDDGQAVWMQGTTDTGRCFDAKLSYVDERAHT